MLPKPATVASAISPLYESYLLPGYEPARAENASACGAVRAINWRLDLGVEPVLVPTLDLHQPAASGALCHWRDLNQALIHVDRTFLFLRLERSEQLLLFSVNENGIAFQFEPESLTRISVALPDAREWLG